MMVTTAAILGASNMCQSPCKAAHPCRRLFLGPTAWMTKSKLRWGGHISEAMQLGGGGVRVLCDLEACAL